VVGEVVWHPASARSSKPVSRGERQVEASVEFIVFLLFRFFEWDRCGAVKELVGLVVRALQNEPEIGGLECW